MCITFILSFLLFWFLSFIHTLLQDPLTHPQKQQMTSLITTPTPTLTTLPVDVLIDIALALPCCEFGRLLQTNRYIHMTLDTHWVWHQRFVIRMGQALLAAKLKQVAEEGPSSRNVAPTPTPKVGELPGEVPSCNLRETSSATKEQLIEWYRQYVRTTIPARDMAIIHMNNRHWRMEPDATSQFGEVARLNYVNWLDVSAVFHGIVPGRYYVQWSLIVSSTYNIEDTLFRAATIPGHEIPAWDNAHSNTIAFIPTTESSFIKATNSTTRDRFQPGPMLLQLPDQLEVGPEHPTVFVQFKNHDNYRVKSALSVDYVRLVSVDDLTRAFVPEPVDPQWEARESGGDGDHIQARRDFVVPSGDSVPGDTEDEGTAEGNGDVPWFAPSQWMNFLWGAQGSTAGVEQDGELEPGVDYGDEEEGDWEADEQ